MADAPRRLRVAVGTLREGERTLAADDAHYVARVLRLAAGDALELFDGAGLGAWATVCPGLPVRLAVAPPSPRPAPPALTLALAMPKGERATWLVEKATELGVTTLHWLIFARSVVLPRGGDKAARLARVAAQAARQAGRFDLPQLTGPTPLAEFLAAPDHAEARRLIAHPGAPPLRPSLAATATAVIVGPEGGLAPEELRAATAAGYDPCGLSSLILRVETAALAVAARVWGGHRDAAGP